VGIEELDSTYGTDIKCTHFIQQSDHFVELATDGEVLKQTKKNKKKKIQICGLLIQLKTKIGQ
jgi:hypothetical protein